MARHKMRLILSALLVLLILITNANGNHLHLWSLSPDKVSKHHRDLRESNIPLFNRRLETLSESNKHLITLPRNLVSTLEPGHSISFDVPAKHNNGHVYRPVQANDEYEPSTGYEPSGFVTKSCILKHGNPLVPQALAEQVPSIKLLRCVTNDNEELQLVINTERDDGVNGAFFGKHRDTFYIDSAVNGSDMYILYDTKTARREGTPPEHTEEVIHVNESEWHINPDSDKVQARLNRIRGRRNQTDSAQRLATSTVEAFTFRLVVAANKQYSAFHGNTLASVLTALITCFSRVNHVYAHEFGVQLEFIPSETKAICLSTSSSCNLRNDGSVIDTAKNFLTSKGISYNSYDVGHVVTTGSGGLAAYPGACTADSKAAGTTGLATPINDIYYIDFVAHEIGHMFLGAHVFRDCDGPSDGNLMTEAAVEPGSGSSIMGYAGICGDNDVQSNSDPYFNSINLEQMYDYMLSIQTDSSCGSSVPLTKSIPTIDAPEGCSAPVGNAFQLKGTSDSVADEVYFSWDRVDTAAEDYSSTSLGKFRSWKPTSARTRFFPNLFFQNFYGSVAGAQMVELLPKVARDMSFRFSQRRLYATEGNYESDGNLNMDQTYPFVASQMGDFIFADTQVAFSSVGAMSLVYPKTGSLMPSGQTVVVSWKKGGVSLLSPDGIISVYIARNTFEEVDFSDFDYEDQNKELDWIKLGEAMITSEQAAFTIPILDALNNVTINVMLRASSLPNAESDGCFFFDLATKVTLVPPVAVIASPTVSPTRAVSASPTVNPTRFPSASPTINPTDAVSASPTLNPTRAVSASPTVNPTRFSSASPTVNPTGAVVASPTANPTDVFINGTTVPTTSSDSSAGSLDSIVYIIAPIVFVMLLIIISGVIAVLYKRRKQQKGQPNAAVLREMRKKKGTALAVHDSADDLPIQQNPLFNMDTDDTYHV